LNAKLNRLNLKALIKFKLMHFTAVTGFWTRLATASQEIMQQPRYSDSLYCNGKTGPVSARSVGIFRRDAMAEGLCGVLSKVPWK
jgi:hypothetical protein